MPPWADYTGPDLCALPAHEVVALLRCGEISRWEVLEASIQRIEAVDPVVNALPALCFDRAFANLASVSTGSLLAGLPVTIKDNIEVEGVITTFGSPIYRHTVSKTSDRCVLAVEAAGGLVVAKSNLPELSAGGMCSNPVFGTTRNPWDVRKTCGGSSGGGAVAVATGQAWLSVGGDLAGSLRTPAAFCGIVGMRPTPGTVFSGVKKNSADLEATNGPMARSVRDCGLLLDALAGRDHPYYELGALRHQASLRIAYSGDIGGICSVDFGVSNVLSRALDTLKKDHHVFDCDEKFIGLDESYRSLRGLFFVNAYGGLAPEIQSELSEDVRKNISFGLSIDQKARDIALTLREALREKCEGLLKGVDVIACPVVGQAAPDADLKFPFRLPGDDYLSWLSFSFLASLLGLPAISLPIGFDEAGMPVGLQLIGSSGGDLALIAAAASVERSLGNFIGPIDPIF